MQQIESKPITIWRRLANRFWKGRKRHLSLVSDNHAVRRNYSEDYRQSQELLQLVMEATNDGIWDYDIAGGVVLWSERAQELTGLGALLGRDFLVLKNKMHIEDRREFERKMESAIRTGGAFSLEVRLMDSQDKLRILLIRGKAKINAHNKPLRMAGSISDLTSQKEAEQELVYAAYHDVLTGVKNRKLFLERLDSELQRVGTRSQYLFAVILLDLDNFKSVNDALGHCVGDKVLTQVAKRLSLCTLQKDVVARVGGDEFAILVRDIQSPGEVQTLVQRVQAELYDSVMVSDLEISVTASIGVAFCSHDTPDPEQVLANADMVLQKAKSQGSGLCEFFTTGMREQVLHFYQMENDLRKAIQNHELELYYQPIIDIRTGETNSLEALVRWHSASKGFISPVDFIPMAEKSGLILPLGEQILRMACEQTQKWVSAGYTQVTVAVNFSARQFASESIAKIVREVLDETGLHPKHLKLEITEHAAMNEVEKTIGTMQDLTNMGLHISIDDFGTGYSSLSYLKKYPIKTLKIDRSFIKDIPYDTEDVAITRTIIAMAKSLDLNLIAEGVETLEQLEFLRTEGCHHIQGFYFSHPLCVEDATLYLSRHAQK